MLMFSLLALLVVGQFVTGLLLFLEGKRTKRTDQRIFAGLCFLLILWTIAVGSLTGVDAANAATHQTLYSLANKAGFSLSCAVVLMIYWFSQIYPARRKLGWAQKLFLIVGTALVILTPLPIFSGTFTSSSMELAYHYGSWAILVPIYAVLALFSIYKQEGGILRRTHDMKMRAQSTTLLIGITLTILQVIVFVLVLPGLLGQNPILYAIGYAAPYNLIIFTGYALLRQGLFDIRAIVVRSLTYFLSVLIASLVYVSSIVLLANLLLDTPLSTSTLVLLVVMTLVVAFLFQPLKQYFNRITNRFFYRDYYDPQDLLDKISTLLVGTVDINEITQKTKLVIEDTMKPMAVRFMLHAQADKQESRLLQQLSDIDQSIVVTDELNASHHSSLRNVLHKNDVALAIRLRTTHEKLGYLFLGIRRSGDGYSNNDRRLLGVIADELAIGLQNSLRFQEIQNFNRTLEEKIEDATKRLRQTNAKLKALDQTKDDFISMASHQLRTPLTSVKGYVSMVLDGDAGELTPLQRKLLTQSFVSSQRMVYLISDLLNVSRLKTGKFVIEAVPTNLVTVIEDEVEQLQETAAGRELNLVFNKPETFPDLMLDETKIRQVIMNFMDNAIYYTPSGGTITINLVEKPQSVEFTVVDNGIGVPKHEQHHLFSKFYRAHNAKRARPDGTGLGLFMAKKVIVAQGGALIFKSQEKKGSTFGFTFAKAPLLPPVKPSAPGNTTPSK